MQRSYNKGFNFDVRNGFGVMQQSHAFTSNVANFHVSFLLPTIYVMLLQDLPRWGNQSTEYCREPWSVLTARWRLQYCRYPLENSDCPLRGKYILVCVKERILGICVRFENLRENSTNAKSTSKATIFKHRISSCYILQACWGAKRVQSNRSSVQAKS